MHSFVIINTYYAKHPVTAFFSKISLIKVLFKNKLSGQIYYTIILNNAGKITLSLQKRRTPSYVLYLKKYIYISKKKKTQDIFIFSFFTLSQFWCSFLFLYRCFFIKDVTLLDISFTLKEVSEWSKKYKSKNK